jgi:hypothetical protein
VLGVDQVGHSSDALLHCLVVVGVGLTLVVISSLAHVVLIGALVGELVGRCHHNLVVGVLT